MIMLNGGWTLLLTNPINSIWKPNEFTLRNSQTPSISEPFSILKYADHLKSYSHLNYEYMIKIDYQNNSFGAIISVTNKNSSLLSEIPQDEDIILIRKFGAWDYFSSSLSRRIPWIMYRISKDGIRYPVLTSSLDPKVKEGVLIDVLENDFKFSQFDPSPAPITLTYWLREGVSSDSNVGGFIDISGIEAEISVYYLSVQLINTENISVVVEYFLGGSHQILDIKEKNSTTIFTVIQSITMPISVMMRAYDKNTRKPLLLDCREELNAPIYYLKDDIFIATISDECDSLYPELFDYYYDYIIYNSLSEAVVLKINLLNVSNIFVIAPHTSDDWKGTVTYLHDPNFVLSVTTFSNEQKLLIDEKENLSIEPQENKNQINKIIIREQILVKPKKLDKVCFYSIDVVNNAIITIDLTWRDDIVLAVIEPSERISLTYQLIQAYEDVSNNSVNFQVYPHDIKLAGIIETFVNQKNQEFAECTHKISPIFLSITSNITDVSKLNSQIKSQKIMLDQKEEQICPPTIHGGYSSWSSWSDCNAQCFQNGSHSRHRTCTYPTPENGGLSCTEQSLGSSGETETCIPANCTSKYNSNLSLDFNLNPSLYGSQNSNLVIEFVNTLNTVIGVHIFTFDVTGKSNKYLNFTLKSSSTKTIIFNYTILPLNCYMKITSKNILSGKSVKVSGNDELTIGHNEGLEKLSVSLGNVTDININSYYINMRFMNNAGRKARLTFNLENSKAFSLVKYVEPGDVLTVKTKINSVVYPNSYVISCDSEDEWGSLFLNGEVQYTIYPFTNDIDVLLVVIEQEKGLNLLSVKYINIMFVNTLPETVTIRLFTIYESHLMKIFPGQLTSYYQRIFSPVEIFVDITSLRDSYNEEMILIDSLPSVKYVADQSEYNIRLYTIGKKDMMIDLSNYFIKIRVVNLASQPASISWRSHLKEDYVKEGHEKRIGYSIYSSIRPPAIVVRGNLIDKNSCFVNGRGSTYIIPSKSPTDYMTILLSEVSDYTVNTNNDFIYLNVSARNTLDKFIVLKWGWAEGELTKVTLYPASLSTYMIQAPASDPIVFEAVERSNNRSLMVNGTSRFGILPSQFSSNFNLYIGNDIAVRKVGFKLLNENKKEDVLVLWKYGDTSNSVRIPKDSGVDLQLLQKVLTQAVQFASIPTIMNFGYPPMGWKKYPSFQIRYLIFLGSLLTSQKSMILILHILTVKLHSNYSEDIFFTWSDGEKLHSIKINVVNSPTYIFSCFSNCPISTIQFTAFTLNKSVVFLNGKDHLILPYSSEFSTTINPVIIDLKPSNIIYAPKINYTYNPIVVNTLNEPVILLWHIRGNGWEKYSLPPYKTAPFLINFNDTNIIKLLMNAISENSKSPYLINGLENFTYTSEKNCPPNCESTEQLVIHKAEDHMFKQNGDFYKFTFDNKVMKTVSLSIDPGDRIYEVGPLEILVIDIKISNITKEGEKNVISINAFDKESGYPLKLNESNSGLRIFTKEPTFNAIYVVIKAPDLSIIPTNLYVLNQEYVQELNSADILEIHGPNDFYSTVIHKSSPQKVLIPIQ
ncbi:hypothetical protein MXB_3998 [Myxobolus squamalis]|nr:hypothetical protein MXB_3998 [Myxobolus squamalis]